MKIFGGFLAVLTMTLFVFGTETVQAACANTSTLGAVELSVPQLPDRENHALWIRMQSANTSGQVMVEINGGQCVEVGGDLKSEVWTWKSPDSGLINFDKKEGNTVKLIGVSHGIRIDRVLLTEEGCVPTDFGSNCQGAVELEQAKKYEVTVISPPSKDPVMGKVMVSQTPVENQASLTKVEYIVQSEIIQTVYGAEAFDTTLIPSGKVTVQVYTYLNDGRTIREATVLDVRNKEHFYSNTQRWVRRNARTVQLVLIIAVSILMLGFLVNFLRKIYLSNRERKFHGF